MTNGGGATQYPGGTIQEYDKPLQYMHLIPLFLVVMVETTTHDRRQTSQDTPTCELIKILKKSDEFTTVKTKLHFQENQNGLFNLILGRKRTMHVGSGDSSCRFSKFKGWVQRSILSWRYNLEKLNLQCHMNYVHNYF